MTRERWFTLTLTAVTLLLVGLIWTDWLPWLRGPAPETAEWYWPHTIRPAARWLIPTLAALLMWEIAAWWLKVGHGRHAKWGLLALIGGSFLLQIGLMGADNANIRDEMINRVYSNQASGFFQPAVELPPLPEALPQYPQLMPGFSSEHARTHPPGLLIANRLTVEGLRRAPALAEWLAPPSRAARCIDLWLLDRDTAVAATLTVWAILPLLAAALTVLPAYALSKEMLPDTAVPLAVVLTAAIPALLLFAPKAVQFYAPLGLLIFLAFYLGLKRWSWGWFFLAGLLYSLATFLNLGNTALAGLLAVFALLFLWSGGWPTGWRKLLGSGLVFALGAAVFWLAYWLLWNVPVWEIYRVGLNQHYELVTLKRNYSWWIISNPVDLLIFAGLPLMIGFAGNTLLAIQKIVKKSPISNLQSLTFSLIILIFILDLSGSARGEVGRLWLFFMPLLALPAAQFLKKRQPRYWQSVLIIGLQLLITLSLALAWQPVRAVTVNGVRPSPPTTVPDTAVTITFTENRPNAAQIALTGYTLTRSDQVLDFTLFWQADKGAARPYTVYTQLLNEQNEIIAQQDNWPVNGQWPPTCWRSDETIADSYRLPRSPGQYRLVVGLYDAATGERLLTDAGLDGVVIWETAVPDEYNE
ncbi:MAG: hypothetical protein HF973_07980 [Chloroflexi bacterium]|nr:hypothetical protein [Chloroflexota bacterium]